MPNLLDCLFGTLCVHRNVCGNVWLWSYLLQDMLVVFSSHQLVYKLVAPLYDLVDLIDLFFLGFFVVSLLVFIIFGPLDCVV